MITEYLFTGIENARTARELSEALNCDTREITAMIKRERRQGSPIIASCDPEQPGYYLAETAEELQRYCGRLRHRAGEIFKTRSALLEAAAELPTKQEAK